MKKLLNFIKNTPLSETDALLWKLIRTEKQRQMSHLDLNASENFTSRAILECLGSCLTNRYTEGYPNTRIPRGTHIINEIERLTQARLLNLYGLKTEGESLHQSSWGVNVQIFSGSSANMATYMALLEPHDRIMGLDVTDGGHPTHGFRTRKAKMSATSVFFETMPYKINRETEMIDYDQLEFDALRFHPKIIIAGICAHPRKLDYARYRKICDSVGAILLADMAHISGLVAGGVLPSPFEYADIVTSTTHKTLRGPRSGMIFYRKKPFAGEDRAFVPIRELERRINNAVFPGIQSGPHMNVIAAMACMAHEASSSTFRDYCMQVLKNCQALADNLKSSGIRLLSGGSDKHFLIIDLTKGPFKATGDATRVQIIADGCGLTFSAFPLPSDSISAIPSGLRLGTPALTTRGFMDEDFAKVANYVLNVLEIYDRSRKQSPSWASLPELMETCPTIRNQIIELRDDVTGFASLFAMPGFDDF